jgi:hypothetical protein
MGKLAAEFFGALEPPFGLPKHRQRDRRVKVVLPQALMGGGIVEFHKRLVCLLELYGRGRQGELVVIKPPLDVEMGLP